MEMEWMPRGQTGDKTHCIVCVLGLSIHARLSRSKGLSGGYVQILIMIFIHFFTKYNSKNASRRARRISTTLPNVWKLRHSS